MLQNLIKNIELDSEESHVLKLFALEHSEQEIASMLHVKPKHISQSIRKIKSKTGAKNVGDLIKYAYAKGIIKNG